jgi:hypothetical protein
VETGLSNQKVDLDIRVILAQLNIEFEKFVNWEENECSETMNMEAVAQS